MEFVIFKNADHVQLSAIPKLDFCSFAEALKRAVDMENCRIAAFFTENDLFYALLIDPAAKCFRLTSVAADEYTRSLTPEIAALHWFEREIAEQSQHKMAGHPWLKPIRFENSDLPGVTDYFTMQGNAVHEVAVGPVHAGVIEPGHFRFQCMGEDVYNLEIELGYQHRGIEKMLINASGKLRSHLAETAAGDSSIAYALTLDAVMNALAEKTRSALPEKANILRTLALELERIANHVGDIGALAGDVAFLPTSAYCGRIRGDFLNMTAQLCGNRFGRNYITANGVAFDLEKSSIPALREWFERTVSDFKNAWELMADDPSVLDRLENTGTVPTETMKLIGGVGVPARASGLEMDVRSDLGNIGIYDKLVWKIPVKHTCDVLARAKVRRLEIRDSVRMIRALFSMLETADSAYCDKNLSSELPEKLQGGCFAAAAVEGWRGEVVMAALTDENGKLQRLKIVDPSFHNWFALALALRNEQISNFPICNKSFNLSYCGHDL